AAAAYLLAGEGGSALVGRHGPYVQDLDAASAHHRRRHRAARPHVAVNDDRLPFGEISHAEGQLLYGNVQSPLQVAGGELPGGANVEQDGALRHHLSRALSLAHRLTRYPRSVGGPAKNDLTWATTSRAVPLAS